MGSRIEAGLTIEGSVRGEGELTVGGRLRGVLTLQGTLVVEEGGSVEAEVEANSVIVAGLLTGSVTAHEELRVLPGGCVDARVRATRLAMAEGAIFRGELQAAVTQSPPALQSPGPQRLAGRQGAQQLGAGAYASDAIPPIPTLQKAPHAHMQVAAPPPPVYAQRHATINPPPPGARASDADYDSLVPTPTTPAPAPTTKPRRATIPPAPRVPEVAVEPVAPRPSQVTTKPRAFAAPPAKSRAPEEATTSPAPRNDQPKARDRNASPRMPTLPQKRGSMARRGGA